MTGLVLENLSKTFPGGGSAVVALERLNLEVRHGEILVVLGPSGSGKTTLLRLIAGLEEPTTGTVTLNGESLAGKKPHHRAIGMAFQYPALLPQLSIAQNISLGPKLRGIQATETAARTRELAELLGITHLLDRAPETLSGGQQQRVSLARALAVRPKLLLLDEPLASLDPTARHELREAIRAAQQKLGVTTLYVTHDQAEAAALGDRIAILKDGVLQQSDVPSELYGNPSHLFVAIFLGPDRPNVFEGDLTETGFRPSGSGATFGTSVLGLGKATCVIRQRAILPGGPLEGVLERVRQTGWSTALSLTVSGVLLQAELLSKTSLHAGERFRFSIDPTAVFLFDASGLRIR